MEQKGFKYILYKENTVKVRFYYHNLQIDDVPDKDIIALFDKIKKETDSGKPPYYINKPNSRRHLQIINKEESENKVYFFGKLIQSHKSVGFKEEKSGELLDIELDKESGICTLRRGVIYFILFINKESSKRFLMVEDVPFALNIGGLVDYLKKRLNKYNVKTKQELGRELVPVLNAVGGNKITIARIRFKKNVSTEHIAKLGIAEDAFKELKKENLDCELVIRWSKDKGELFKDFLKRLFKIDALSDINTVDFGSFLRTLYFEIDSAIQPTINMKDDIIKFFPQKEKEYCIEHEDELYILMKDDFDDKYNNSKFE